MKRPARNRFGLCSLAVALLAPAPAWAQAGPAVDWGSVTTHIETDGTLGGPKQPIAPVGSDYTIGEDLGTRAGSNLFHSFSSFDLGAADTALFTATQSTENVVSRITGGEPSKLAGTLRSDIPSANLYFLNPSGVFFGPNAALDVRGAFHLSTAQDDGFANGMKLVVTPEGGGPPLLEMATLDEFGFLAAPIRLDGTAVFFGTTNDSRKVDGEVSLRGGDIELAGGGGFVGSDENVTLAGSGRVLFNETDSGGFGAGINLKNAPGMSGSVLIRGEYVELTDGASIVTRNLAAECDGSRCGGSITIEARSEIKLHGTNQDEEGSTTEPIFGEDFTLPLSLARGSVDLLTLNQRGDAKTGAISLSAPVVRILGGADVTTVTAGTTGQGAITVATPQLLEIAGLGGDGLGSRVRSQSVTSLDGASGDIAVVAGSVQLRDGGTLASNTAGNTAGGNITVFAEQLVSISGRDNPKDPSVAPQPSSIQAAQILDVGTGAGGNIAIEAPRIELAGGGQILALSEGTGNAGSVTLTADEVRLSNGGVVSVEAKAADGGNLSIQDRSSRAGALVVLEDSRLEASVQGGEGGSILIGDSDAPAEALILAGESRIDASAGEPGGQGGRVEVNAQAVFLSGDSEITASAPGGPEAQGQVILNNPGTAIESQVIPPKVSYVDASSMLLAQCGRASGGGNDSGGRFTMAAWPSVPGSADDSLLAFSPLGGGLRGGLSLPSLADGQADPNAESITPATSYQIAMRSGGEALRGGRAEQAEGAFVEAREAAARSEDHEAQGAALRGLADAQQIAGAYRKSLTPLLEALALARADDDAQGEARALGALGQAYGELGENAPAERYLRDAVDVSRGIEFHDTSGASANDTPTDAPTQLTGSLLGELGNQHTRSGNAAGALAAYQQSAGAARGNGAWLVAAQAQANAARAALALKDADVIRGALRQARESLERAEVSPDEQTAFYLHLAYTEATFARQALAARRPAMLAAHGDLLRALMAIAEGAGNARAASQALGQLGGLYAQEGGRDRESRHLTRRALQLAEQEQAADLLARWYAQLGAIEWRNQRADAALDAYRRAVSLLEQTRPEAAAAYGRADLAFRQAVEPVYLALVDVLLQSSRQDPSPAAQQSHLHEARNVVEQWKAAELRNYFRDGCAAELAATAQSVEHVDPRAAVIYPIVLPDRLELLVSRASGITQYTVPVTGAQLQEEVARFRRGLGNRLTAGYISPAQQLYTWLVEPYAASLEDTGVDTLVFVPGGALRTVPLSALHDGTGFLLERYAVAITPSLDLLAPKPLDPEKTEFLLAGLSDAVQGYPGLPGVESELQAIESLYGGDVLLNESFDAENLASALRNQRPGIVHLASHAEFTGDPDTSFVLTHDGRLSMDELTTLVRTARYGDEPVELLMLSACETAVGDERAALGLAGVAIRAGARSAMGSLWSVSDDATSKLVIGFYDALGKSGISKARALREAQQRLMADERFQHPFYWAPFLVINNWL